jgi:PAS domain S-box-containing protein
VTLSPQSLRGQAARRLGGALLFSMAMAAMLVIFGLQALESRRQLGLNEDIKVLLQSRLLRLDETLLRNARQIMVQIEFTRIMDSPPPVRQDRLLGLFTALGEDLSFDTVEIRDGQGRPIFIYGHEADDARSLHPPTGTVSGHYSKALGDYHRLVALPIWTGQDRGEVVFKARVDNAVLTQMAPLRTLLSLVHAGSPLAASLAPASAPNSVYRRFTMPIRGDLELALDVAHYDEMLLSREATLALACSSALVLAAALWWALGRWLGRLGNRVEALGAACAAFPAVHAIDDDIRTRLESAQQPDEVGAVATSLQSMMIEIGRSEERLRETEQRWQRALESSSIGVWDWDPRSGRIFLSRAWKAMLGHQDDEIPNEFDEWTRRVHPDDLAGQQASLQAHLRGETSAYVNEHRMRTRQGGWCWVQHQGLVFERSPEGSPIRVVGTQIDITERRAMVAELELHRSHLESLVQARTAELSAARDEASRLARVKTDFLANMSHEMRTPLNAVMGFAQVGVKKYPGQPCAETFGRIQDAGQHLLHVINDVLDFSRLDAGKLPIERKPFDLAAAIAQACDLFASDALAKRLDFKVSAAPDLPRWVLGDAQRLQQILVNLLSNAVKFTERGGVSLQVTLDCDDIWFKVIDSGIGMDPEHIDRLFRPFEQADSSTTRRFGGSGLGLAISQNLARLMGGGQIAAESRPGAGSTVSLRLSLPPVATPVQSPAIGARSAPEVKRLAGLRLLAAEDDEVNRLILEAMLLREGADLVVVVDGLKVVEQVRREGVDAFDLVLMDLQMPLMDGFEATRRLKELAPTLPVIALTARAFADERERSRAAGMVEHLSKPIDLEDLVRAIRNHVTR